MNKKFLLDGTRIDISTKETQRETTSHIIIHEDAKNIAEAIIQRKPEENLPWYKSKRRFLIAILLYLSIKSEGDGFTIEDVWNCLPHSKTKDNVTIIRALDEIFMNMEAKYPEHIAIQYYKSARIGREQAFLQIAKEVYDEISNITNHQE